MSNIIDSIQLSGVTYTIQGSGGGITSGEVQTMIDQSISGKQDVLSAGTGISISGNVISATGGGGSPTVELTQAEYDALVSAGTVSADTYYIITDASPQDMSNYWTSAQTQSAINQATSGKASQSDLETVSGNVDTLSGTVETKQDTLVSGTNIKTINNQSLLGSGNIDIQGGGGITSGEVQTMIDESVSGKADTSAVTAVQDSLSGYVTTNTQQEITGNKTFIGSSNTNNKPIIFKQANDSHKIGFVCQNSASTNNELATFEFRPNTYTDSSSVSHPLLYIGHYRNTNTANAGVVQTMVGFRQYDQSGAAAYHYLMPLPAEAKTPFSLTTSFKNYFAPLGFKNGDTMITTDNTGVADFSSVLGGLKLVKLTQLEYDALTTKDDNTVYFIGDSTNGYTMKIGSANVN